jgi:hypothetical protein
MYWRVSSMIRGSSSRSARLCRVTGKRVGEDEVVRDLPGEPRFPEGGEELRRGPSAHLLDHRGDGERARVRKAIENRAEPEPVIAVAVRDVDRGQVLSMGRNPVAEVACLADGH